MSNVSASRIDVATSDPPKTFKRLVLQVVSILNSEVESRGLQYSVVYTGGSWTASIWKHKGNELEVVCRRGPGETGQTVVKPFRPDWPARFIEWPSPAFERELKAAIGLLE